jgi:hypothetical protein
MLPWATEWWVYAAEVYGLEAEHALVGAKRMVGVQTHACEVSRAGRGDKE